MKNLYVYILNGKEIKEKEMYDVIVKRNGDIIMKEDNYLYNKEGRTRMRNGREHKDWIDKFYVGCYCKKDESDFDDWFVKFISYEEQDKVTLKPKMIKAFQDYINERHKKRIEQLDKEKDEYYKKMINKRKEYVDERDALQDLAFLKFL